MKPSWDDAPEWAQYLAQDEDGEWCWFKLKPWIVIDTWVSSSKWKYAEIKTDPSGWRDTLEQRDKS